MMGELKFRAWIREKNYDIDRDTKKVIELNDSYKMVKVSSIHLGTKKIIYGYSEDSYYYGNRSVSFDNIKLMQYIGVKDKKGKEIYEGDIVKIYIVDDDDNLITINGLKVVNFSNGCFRFGCKEFSVYNCCQKFFEVIGNIYENPELLEGDEE